MELAFGHPPYAKMLPLKAMMATMDSDPPTPEVYNEPARVKEMSKDFRKFIARTMQKDPAKRPTAAELVSDPFIKKAHGAEYLAEHLIAKYVFVAPAVAMTCRTRMNVFDVVYTYWRNTDICACIE